MIDLGRAARSNKSRAPATSRSGAGFGVRRNSKTKGQGDDDTATNGGRSGARHEAPRRKPCVPIGARRKPKACTTPATRRTPAASALSRTSRAASRTRSSRTRSRSCSISSIAARSARIRARATAPAFWCRSRTSFLRRRQSSLALSFPRPVNMRSATCFCRASRNGGR